MNSWLLKRHGSKYSGKLLLPGPLRPDGGAEGVRTPDLLNAIQALYQLSYDPVQSETNLICRNRKCQKRNSSETEPRADRFHIFLSPLGPSPGPPAVCTFSNSNFGFRVSNFGQNGPFVFANFRDCCRHRQSCVYLTPSAIHCPKRL